MNVKRTRTGALVAVGLALATMLSACGSGSDAGNAASSVGAAAIPAEGIDDGTRLTMWVRAGLEGRARAFVAAYNEQFRNQVAVEVVNRPGFDAVPF